jgi:serine/threonine-protein kinase ATR
MLQCRLPSLTHPQAKDALATIDGRLCGTLLGVYSQPSLPLSVEGHAARLIAEAVDKENLGKMYIWWMAWM